MGAGVLVSLTYASEVLAFGPAIPPPPPPAPGPSLPTGSKVIIPCLGPPAPDYVGTACNLEYLQCAGVIADIKAEINAKIDKKIDYFYSIGKDVDLFGETTSPDPNTVPSTSISVQRPICNLAENEVSSVTAAHAAITPVNFRNCGQPVTFRVGGIDLPPGGVGIEDAYINGFFLQALKCYRQQVFNEIDQTKSVSVQVMTAAANDVQGQVLTYVKAIKDGALTSICSLPSACSSNLDKWCGPSLVAGGGSTAAAIADPVSKEDAQAQACQRGAVCKLRSAEKDLVGAFKYMVITEIESRARAAWTAHQNDIKNRLVSQVKNPCDASSRAACPYQDALVAAALSPDLNCYAAKMNECYLPRVRSTLQGLIGTYFPSSGACQ